MHIFYVDLAVGIPSELSTIESKQKLEEAIRSSVTQMIHQICPQSANAEFNVALNFELGMVTTRVIALPVEGNSTAH